MPKISQLNPISQLTTSSILPVVDNGATQNVTLKRVVEFVSASIDVTFATEIELLQSASSITSSLNAFASASILSVNSKLSTSSFETYTASVSVANVDTSSLLLTSSFNTFTSSYKSDSASFDSRVDNLELINVTPFLSSSTFNTFTSSYTTHSSSIDSRLDILEGINVTPFLSSSTFNSYTASISTASLVSRLNQIESVSGSWITESETGSFALTANLPIITPFLSSSTFNTFTSSLNGTISSSAQITAFGFLSSSSAPAGTISGSSQITGSISLANITGSNVMAGILVTGYQLAEAKITVLQSKPIVFYPNISSESVRFTTAGGVLIGGNHTENGHKLSVSGSARVIGTTSITGSLVVSDGIAGAISATNGVISGSSQISELGFATTSSVLNIDTSSLVTTSSFNTFTSSYTTHSSSFDSRINSIVNGSGFATTSSFNSFTSSINSYSSSINTFTASINTTTASLNLKTGSYATTGSNQFNGNQSITGSLTVTSLTTISSSISANSSSLFLNSGSNLYVQNNGVVEITGSLIVSGSMILNVPVLYVGTGSGVEGGEIDLAYAQTTTLTGSALVFDVYQDRLRIFENGGTNRGAYLNVVSQSTGVGSEIVTSPNVSTIQTITSASYAALTPVSGTLYIIIG